MRLLIALPLAPEVVTRLTATVARLRSANNGLRWTAPASWHITLQFLGEATPLQCKELQTRLEEVVAAPFLVQMEGIGAFARTGVVYAGVCLSPALLSLEQKIVAATAPAGFAAERRRFHPHITLARAQGRKAGPLKLLPGPALSSFTATEFRLYESFLDPAGARYELRARFPLGAES